MSVQDLIERAYSIHKSAKKDAIEFIIAYCNEEKKRIVSIKDGEITENCFAWIGSPDTYYEYRRSATEKNILGIKSIREVESMIVDAIRSGIDDSVGGYIINIRYLKYEYSFQYMEQLNATSGLTVQQIKPGENVNIVQGVERGSYTYQTYQSPERVALYLVEPQNGIVYTYWSTDGKMVGLNSLYMPHLLKMDQIDFDVFAWQVKAERGIFVGDYSDNDIVIRQIKSCSKNHIKNVSGKSFSGSRSNYPERKQCFIFC